MSSQLQNSSRQLVFRVEDTSNPIEVIDQENTRTLYFGTAWPQSTMCLANPYALVFDYTQVMLLSLLFQSCPKSILMLGLGGGSLPKFFWKTFPRCHIDGVVQSSLVVDVCYRYFALPKSPRLQVKITDAFHFINQTTHQYDLLFIDLFINDDVPKWPSSFFSLCRQRLKNKKSVLICNFLTGGSKDLLFEFLTQVAASFDQHTIILPTKNGENYILFAFPETIEFPTSWVMFQKILNIEKKIRFPFSQIWNDVSQLVLAASKS